MNADKVAEKLRYDRRAERLKSNIATCGVLRGSGAVSLVLRAPYRVYESSIRGRLSPGMAALEIGAGTGEFTAAALEAGAVVTATDISDRSLEALLARFPAAEGRLVALAADMEMLPFGSEVFDAVISAGSLSYGDNHKVIEQVYRVIKPGGAFICVDSLNHNPVYRLNRFVHRLRGERTASTLRRMPTLALIDEYRKRFGRVEVLFFGSASWILQSISKIIGDGPAAMLSDCIDRWVGVRRSAFKFVMIATKTGD